MTGYTLTEIEEGAQVLTNTTGACNPESVILLPSAHYHWLLARVRELEAQAVRDAKRIAAMNDALVAGIISGQSSRQFHDAMQKLAALAVHEEGG